MVKNICVPMIFNTNIYKKKYLYNIMTPPELGGILTMIITLSPFFITIFLILQSFVKHNLQGIVYLCGLILAQMLGYLVRPLFGNMGVRPDIVLLESGQKFIRKGRACNIIEDPWFSMYSCPSFHAIFHTFTIFFIHGYEFFILGGVKNLGLFLTLITLYVLDGIFRIYNTCITPVHWLIGTLFGLMLGIAYWFLVYLINPKMVYNSFISEKKSCKLSKQRFNCKMEVYKMKNVNNAWVTEKNPLSESDIAKLTPNQWKDAMANQAMETPVAS
jgi:hypothetical protein